MINKFLGEATLDSSVASGDNVSDAPASDKDALVERTAQLLAHRACCGVEHDPANGKLHGYCIVCGVPWPCDYAGVPPAQSAELQQLRADNEKWKRINEPLYNSMTKAEGELQQLRSELKGIKGARNLLSLALKSAEAQAAQLRSEVTALRTVNKELQSEIYRRNTDPRSYKEGD